MKAASVSLFMLVVFSGFYLTKLGVSPVYFTFAIGGACVIHLVVSGKVYLSRQQILFALLLLLISIVLLAHIYFFDSLPQNVLNVMIGPFSYLGIVILSKKISEAQLIACAKSFWLATVLLATTESVYRLLNPDYDFLSHLNFAGRGESIEFYAYKYNSIMYQDSNFVGLQLVVLLSFMLAFNKSITIFSWYKILYVIALIVLTLSRASILVSLIVLIYSYLYSARKSTRLVLGFVLVPFSLFFVGAIYRYYGLDASFISKIMLFKDIEYFYLHSDFSEMFTGVGVGMAYEHLGIGAHNIALTYLMETGILVSLFFIIFWGYHALTLPGARFILLGWLLNGISLTTYAVPYLYASLGVLVILQRSSMRLGSEGRGLVR